MDHLNISERTSENYYILELIGTVNSYTYRDFQQRVYSRIEKTNVVLDMSRVSRLSSSGLGILMAVIDMGQERSHRLYILNPSEIVRLAIESTGFPELFQIIQSIHEVR
jgi:anti-anti-sigma factor